ncbi:DMT family transporter [soil metagenome]
MKADARYVAGVLLALVATALWGATFLGPAAVSPVGPVYLVFGRYFVFGILSLVILAVNRNRAMSIGVKRALVAAHLGVVGYVGFYLFFSFAAAVGGGALASVATGVMPAAITIASNVIRKEIAWRSLALPIGITSLGLFVVNVRFSDAGPGKTAGELVLTTLLALAACAVWSYFVVVNGLIIKRTDGPRVDNTTWTAMIGAGAFFASFLLLPFAEIGGGVAPTNGQALFVRFVVVSVLLATLGSWCASWCWNRAARRVSTVVMGQLIALETIFGTVFNLVWEQRWPTPQEVAGATLVTIGVIWCVHLFGRSRARVVDPTTPGGSTHVVPGLRSGVD